MDLSKSKKTTQYSEGIFENPKMAEVNPAQAKVFALLDKIEAHHNSQERPNTTQYQLLGTEVAAGYYDTERWARFNHTLRASLEQRLKMESLDALLE